MGLVLQRGTTSRVIGRQLMGMTPRPMEADGVFVPQEPTRSLAARLPHGVRAYGSISSEWRRAL